MIPIGTEPAPKAGHCWDCRCAIAEGDECYRDDETGRLYCEPCGQGYDGYETEQERRHARLMNRLNNGR